jgi:hypothetical protein
MRFFHLDDQNVSIPASAIEKKEMASGLTFLTKPRAQKTLQMMHGIDHRY